MKKLLALLMALLMVLSLAACAAEEEEDTGSRRKKKDTETTSDTTEVTEAEEEEEKEKEDKKDKKSPYTIFEELDVEILDIDEATISISEFEPDRYGDPTAIIEVENHTNEEMHVYPDAVAINGKIVSEYFSVTVDAKDTATYEFTIYDAFEDPDDLTRLTMSVNVLDEDYSGESYLIDIYPQGLDAYEENAPKRSGDVLLDKKDVYVAANKITYPSNYNPEVHYVAFNDADEVYELSIDTLAINEFGIEDYHSTTLLPDTYAEHYFELYSPEQLVQLGMKANELTSITINTTIWDEEYSTVAENETTIYPGGKNNAEEFVYSPDKNDVVVVETDDFRLLQVSTTTDSWNDVDVLFVVENKSGKTLTISGSEAKLNGKDADLYFYCNAVDGRNTFEVLYVYASDLEEVNASKVSSLEMLLEVYDENYKDIYEGTVKFNVTE